MPPTSQQSVIRALGAFSLAAPVGIPTIAPFATKAQAERYVAALGVARTMLVAAHRQAKKKRSMTPTDRADLVAKCDRAYTAIAELDEAIKQAHQIGGY